ncbi:AGAP002112-PA-like protein [Anopheles sinensis]|uniref:AGAP002112-PA-like protein n=1 Tax=Anopheles sinensis TaxID=74873 RepID=A0A084W9V0_ANOSI|nr:AGAP002112-PA-like protein [Anopheles sinensis]
MFDNGRKESDDDEDFFKPPTTGGKSTLAKIFGISSKSATNNNERGTAPSVAPKSIKISDRYGPSNFRYIPSQSVEAEPMAEDTGKPPEWAIVRATVVTAYKLVDGDNVFLGKVGLALLKSSSGHRLLLYRTKTEVLGAVTFTPEVKLILKQDYLQFRTDETGDFWSVLFESEPDRQAMLTVLESWAAIEREPLIEEPMSEAEKDPEPTSVRSNLVARMARMGGQAMPLPERSKAPPIPAAGPGSDSSDTSDSKIETISTRPIRRQNMLTAVGMQMVPLTGMVSSGGTTQNTPGQGTSGVADVNFNLIMSETRMQNTEMRMNISKLESKLDRVLDRIDLLNLHSSSERPTSVADREAEVLALEEKLLELKRENHSLRARVRTLEASELEGKRNADSKLEQKVQAMEVTERRLNGEIASLEEKLESSRTEQERVREKLELTEKQLTQAKETEERNTKELASTMGQLKEAKEKVEQLEKQLTEETSRSADAKTLIDLLRKENETLKQTIATEKERPSASQTPGSALVKEIMNSCYQQLCDQITDPQVLRLIAQTIKRETKAVLDREKNK